MFLTFPKEAVLQCFIHFGQFIMKCSNSVNVAGILIGVKRLKGKRMDLQASDSSVTHLRSNRIL